MRSKISTCLCWSLIFSLLIANSSCIFSIFIANSCSFNAFQDSSSSLFFPDFDEFNLKKFLASVLVHDDGGSLEEEEEEEEDDFFMAALRPYGRDSLVSSSSSESSTSWKFMGPCVDPEVVVETFVFFRLPDWKAGISLFQAS